MSHKKLDLMYEVYQLHNTLRNLYDGLSFLVKNYNQENQIIFNGFIMLNNYIKQKESHILEWHHNILMLKEHLNKTYIESIRYYLNKFLKEDKEKRDIYNLKLTYFYNHINDNFCQINNLLSQILNTNYLQSK